MMAIHDFIAAKAWALFHDPPHKAWYLTNRCRIFEGGHEVEARKLWQLIVKDTALAQINIDKIENVVRRADQLASSLDRWVLPKKLDSTIHDYIHLINPFNLEKVIQNPLHINQDKIMNGYIKDLNEALKIIDGNLRDCYHVLSLLAEIAWAANDLPYGPADTRIPTHSIFDHLYASASMVNWTLKDEPSGYYVFLDIPGIQHIVSGARKAGDFWAGSWLISYLMWKLVEEVVNTLGPDVLLIPTTRLNPFYLRFLCEKGLLRDKVQEIIMRSGVGEYLFYNNAKNVSPIPVMPGTASLALPNPKDLEHTPFAGNKATDIERYFSKRWNVVWKELINMLEKDVSNSALAIIRRIIEENPTIFNEPQIDLRIYVVDINQIFQSLIKDDYKLRMNLYLEDDAKKIEKALEKLRQVTDEKEAVKTILYYAIATLAFRRIKYEKDTTTLSIRPLWPIEYTKRFDERFKLEGGWAYCSVCGVEPAIMKFGREIKDGRESYDSRTKEWIKEILHGETELNEQTLRSLIVQFKPGEALGPLCLIKRGLWLLSQKEVKEYTDIPAPSNEAIALNVTRNAMKTIEHSIDISNPLYLIYFGL